MGTGGGFGLSDCPLGVLERPRKRLVSLLKKDLEEVGLVTWGEVTVGEDWDASGGTGCESADT